VIPVKLAWAAIVGVVCCPRAALSQNQSEVERFAQEGQSALAAERYADAEKAFEKLRQLQPEMAEVHANLGLIYFQERKFEEAVPSLRRALKLKPSLAKSESLLAMSLSETGHYGEAVHGLEKCLHHSSETEIQRMCGLELQRAFIGLKRDDQAVAVAMELNRLFPDDPEILYQTGKIYGNFAFLTMEKLAQVAPNSVWKHLAAAEAQESQGSYDQAIPEYNEVLKLDPRRPGIHYRIGRSLVGRYWQRHSPDDLSASEKEFEQELQIDPANANSAYELGELNRKANRFDDAQRYFEQALRHYPDFPEAQLGLAAVLQAKKAPDQAIIHAQRAVAIDPENEVAWYRLAQIQKALGNSAEQEKALAEYRRLHDRSSQQHGLEPVFSPREVTKQEIEPAAQ
jgi:tetratricopeptide (TPR) repeat protein